MFFQYSGQPRHFVWQWYALRQRKSSKPCCKSTRRTSRPCPSRARTGTGQRVEENCQHLVVICFEGKSELSLHLFWQIVSSGGKTGCDEGSLLGDRTSGLQMNECCTSFNDRVLYCVKCLFFVIQDPVTVLGVLYYVFFGRKMPETTLENIWATKTWQTSRAKNKGKQILANIGTLFNETVLGSSVVSSWFRGC